MTQKIYTGFDCCRDYKNPKRKLKIYPRGFTMNVGEHRELSLQTVHPDCDEACFTWIVAAGGGRCSPNCGISTWYWAPETTEDCDASPFVDAFCRGKLIDSVYIGVTGLPKPVPAVLKALEWEQHEFELAEFYSYLVGMKYCDKDPRVHYWSIKIDEYGCDGSRITRHHIGLASQLIQAGCGIKIYTDRFVRLRIRKPRSLRHGYPIWKTLQPAKEELLRYWLYQYLFGLGTRLHRGFGIEGARWRNKKPSVLYPGDTLDVRMDKVIDLECCPHLFIPT